jgi:hypothetical protein
MDSFDGNNDDRTVPKLEDVCHNFNETFDFLSESMKARFMTGMIRSNVLLGNNHINSPRAKKLKELVQYSQYLPESERASFVEAGVKEYQTLLKTEKEFSQKTFLEPVTTIPNRANMQTSTSSGPFPVRILAMSKSKHLKPSPNQRKIDFDDVVQSQHANLAAALDFLGPAVIVTRTYQSPACTRTNIPYGWYVRECSCYSKSCTAKFIVWSPSQELGSAPSAVRIINHTTHYAHRPIDWMDWYSYRDGKNTKAVDWDESTYPRRPGLPNFIKMGVEDILHFTPHAQPGSASRMVQQRYNDHPLLLNPGPITTNIMKQIQRLVKNSKKKSLLVLRQR